MTTMQKTNESAPTTAIEGIGPRRAETLAGTGVETMADLAACHVHQVASLAQLPVEQVHQWQRAALLASSIGPLDPQLAEALVRAGVVTFERLAAHGLQELAALFEQARAESIIPGVPSPDELAQILVGATRALYTSRALVLVLDQAGQPVPHAEIRVGALRARTDGRGRCWFDRLESHRHRHLFAEQQDGAVLAATLPPIIRDPELVNVLTARLRADHELLGRTRELDGQTLPRESALGNRIDRRGEADLQERDLLRVRQIVENRAELVSLFEEFVDGYLVTVVYDVDIERLPRAATAGENMIVSAPGTLVAFSSDPWDVYHYKRARQADALFEMPAGADRDTRRRIKRDRLRHIFRVTT